MRLKTRPVWVLAVVSLSLSQVSCAQSGKDRATEIKSSKTATIKLSAAVSENAFPNQTVHITDLRGAVRYAVEWHPRILQAAGRVRQQQEAINDARSGYLPSIGGGLNLGSESGGASDWSPVLSVSATQMIYDFGKVSGRISAETAVRDVRSAEFLTTVDEIIRETVLAAIEIKRNIDLNAVAKVQVADTKAVEALVTSRTDRGASTRSDKLQAEARVQAAQATEIELSGQRARWETTIGSLTALSSLKGISLDLPSSLYRSCGIEEPDWGAVPEVVVAEAYSREADARVGLARADMLPTVALEARTEMGLFGKGDNTAYLVGLKVTGDLYNGGSYKARQRAANFAAQASEAGIASAKTNVMKAWAEARSQTSSLEALRASLSSRQGMLRETVDLYKKQFLDLGTRNLLDVLNAVQELHAARFDEINTKYDLFKLHVECAYSAGRLRDAFGYHSPTGPAPPV